MQSWAWAAVGGGVIGLAAGLAMLLRGRIAGISGLVAGLLPPRPAGEPLWRLGFVAGLVLGPLVLLATSGASGIGRPAEGLAGMAAAGFLVGAGTVLGSGCTSGHGVCGLARLSPRSLAATAVFMSVAVAVVTLRRHLL